MLGEDRIAEQKAEEQARLQQDQKAQEQRDIERERNRIIEAAAPLGISAEDASRLWDRFRELQPAMETKFNELEKTLTGTPEEKKEKIKAAMQAELERIAVEALGEKGRALARKLLPSD